MEASDAAEQVVEASEPEDEGGGSDKFRSGAALAIAIMAMLLAIGSLGGGNAAEDVMNNNIQASDTWAFYQAKNVRQTVFRLTAERLEMELDLHRDALTPELEQAMREKIEAYRATVARYEDEPDDAEPENLLKGEGKKQLSARARHYEEERDRAARQDPNFDYSEALFQIAIVLASVSILALSPMILRLALVLGAVATVLMANGFFLLFELPF